MMETKSLSLAEQVFVRLENEILTEHYTRGELLTELKLVSDLGVSRTPIREAIHRLEQEHLVETTQKGIMVIGITDKDLSDIFRIRLRIEGMAAYEAALHITNEQLGEIREALELQEFYVGKGDADHIKSMDNRFHELLYRYSGSTALYDTLLPLHRKVQKYRQASVTENSRARQSAAEHRAIYEAVAVHDAQRAEQLTICHIHNAMEHIIK